MDDVTGKFLFFVLLNMARGFENVCEIISDKTSESLQKSLAGAIYKEEKWRNGNKRVLDNLRRPKVQEIFTTYNYHSISSLWETRR